MSCLFGRNGRGRHPPGTPQYAADETVAHRWWDDIVWPEGETMERGQANKAKAIQFARQAAEKDKPMAWMTNRLKRWRREGK